MGKRSNIRWKLVFTACAAGAAIIMLAGLMLSRPDLLRKGRFRNKAASSPGLPWFYAGPVEETADGLSSHHVTLPAWIPGTSEMPISLLERVASLMLGESSASRVAQLQYEQVGKHYVMMFGTRQPYAEEFRRNVARKYGVELRYATDSDRECFTDQYWAEHNAWTLTRAIPQGWQYALSTAASCARENYLAWRTAFLGSKAYANGCARAKKDLASGKYGLETWGMPLLNVSFFAEAAAKRLPVQVRSHGCSISFDSEMEWAGYNFVMRGELEKRFGSDWYVPILAESEARLLKRRR